MSGKRVNFKCEYFERLRGEDLTSYNILSAILIAYMECFMECLKQGCCLQDISDYVSMFSRQATLLLYNKLSCDNKGLVKQMEQAQRYAEKIVETCTTVFGSCYLLKGTLKSRLIVHMRNPYLPLDVGLAWDPYLNLPYIPASSVKGVVRSYFEEKGITINQLDTSILFGSRDREGYVIFFDAYPVACEKTLIEPEVLTPHYSEVEGMIDETSSKPRAIVYPTVARGVQIIFPLALKIVDEREDLVDIIKKNSNTIVNNISRALEQGIGAKTALGYGYMEVRNM
ncbi:MAG: type III-B CRISPR module RAMP protein Cmr6 [Thermofilaceae archaeon]|nr:type III-B CRISPR module RAMP protein Cmr6 [Thermofilaceae archaeon]MDW8004128.1 type III-B CRISPR module RAMP protein Cmr6 [Thermofilaceae archaeon]